MADNPLAKKLKLKPGLKAAIINAPAGYLQELAPLPAGTQVSDTLDGAFDWVQVFVKDRAGLESVAPRLAAALNPGSLLWVSFPKGSSRMQTDLTRDKGWDSLMAVDLKWVNLVSVNDAWSAFALRPYKKGEARSTAFTG
jgi:hypothetical protein